MDERAQRFRRLIEPLHDRVLAFARCLCRSVVEGDDLFQDAMLRAFGKLDSLRDDDAFRPWLYRIVITVHRTRCRRAFWRRLLPLGELDQDDNGSNPGVTSSLSGHDYRFTGWTPDAAEASRRARQALTQLPVVQREAIVLFEIEGWQVEDIATLQRVSISAVKSRLSRGRAHLRLLYDDQPTPGSTPSSTVVQGDVP